MIMKIKFTEAGRAALINAQNDGTNAVRITQIALSNEYFELDEGLTMLPGQIKPLDTFAGGQVDDDTIHVTIRDESTDVYSMRGFGLVSDTGVLIAVYSQESVILEKTAPAVGLLAIDIKLDAADAELITIEGDTGFVLPPGTELVAGVLRLAGDEVPNTDKVRAVHSAGVVRLINERMGTAGIEDVQKWQTAYGWGDHSAVGYLTSVSWGDVSGTPTLVSQNEAESGSATATRLWSSQRVRQAANAAIVANTTLVHSNVPATFEQDVNINGSLYVNGETVQVDSQISTADRVIILNEGEQGPGVTGGFSGVVVDRGSLTNYEFGFNESTGFFELGKAGSRQAVATRENNPTDKGVMHWDADLKRLTSYSVSQTREQLSVLEHGSGDSQIRNNQQLDSRYMQLGAGGWAGTISSVSQSVIDDPDTPSRFIQSYTTGEHPFSSWGVGLHMKSSASSRAAQLWINTQASADLQWRRNAGGGWTISYTAASLEMDQTFSGLKQFNQSAGQSYGTTFYRVSSSFGPVLRFRNQNGDRGFYEVNNSQMHVFRNGAGTAIFNFDSNGNSRSYGNHQVDGDLNIGSTSDKRLKRDAKPAAIDYDKLDSLVLLEGIYNALAGDKKGQKFIGYYAQDILKIFPNCVNTREHPTLGTSYVVDYRALGFMIAAAELQRPLKYKLKRLGRQILMSIRGR